LYGEGSKYKKLFVGWSIWASMGAADVGPVLYQGRDGSEVGLSAYLKYVAFQFNLTLIDGEISLNYGIGL